MNELGSPAAPGTDRAERARKRTPMHVICVLGISDRVLKPKEYQAFLRACAAIRDGREADQTNVVALRRRR